MHFHSQNLKKEDREKSLIHWRCWFYLRERITIGFAINVPSRFWHIYFDIAGGEEAFGFSIATPLCAIWMHLDWFKLQSWLSKRVNKKGYGGRKIGVSFHDGTFWFSLWQDPMGWSSSDPKWWSFNFSPADFLFGKRQYSETVTQEGSIKIDMPEGLYEATYKRFISYWKRARFPKVEKMHRISIDIPVGIPLEGKGENSWDIGMDATFGSTFPVRENETIYEIAKRFAIERLKERQKYGPLCSPDYLKWKLRNEVRLAKEAGLVGGFGVPPDMVGTPADEALTGKKEKISN